MPTEARVDAALEPTLFEDAWLTKAETVVEPLTPAGAGFSARVSALAAPVPETPAKAALKVTAPGLRDVALLTPLTAIGFTAETVAIDDPALVPVEEDVSACNMTPTAVVVLSPAGLGTPWRFVPRSEAALATPTEEKDIAALTDPTAPPADMPVTT